MHLAQWWKVTPLLTPGFIAGRITTKMFNVSCSSLLPMIQRGSKQIFGESTTICISLRIFLVILSFPWFSNSIEMFFFFFSWNALWKLFQFLSKACLFFDDFFPGGKMPTQGEDLAILSLCNHSIVGVRTAFTISDPRGQGVNIFYQWSAIRMWWSKRSLGYRSMILMVWMME